MQPDFRQIILSALGTARLTFPPSDSTRYKTVIQELDDWVLTNLSTPVPLQAIGTLYREAARQYNPALKRGTIYTRISRLHALLDKAKELNLLDQLSFDPGFPVFSRPGPTPDERRWKAYNNFVNYCTLNRISYKELSPSNFLAYRDEMVQSSAQMAEIRYGDLRRYWEENAALGELRPMAIPRFNESRRTNYGVSADQWPEDWLRLMERFRCAAQGRPMIGDKLWKRHLSDHQIATYAKNVRELLGYLKAQGYRLDEWPPNRVFASAQVVIGFIQWHTNVRCKDRTTRMYHPEVIKRFARLAKHFMGCASTSAELTRYANSLHGETVRKRKEFEDMNYADLSDKALRALKLVSDNWAGLPKSTPEETRKKTALEFRNALLAAFLIRRPLRASNIAALRLNRHIKPAAGTGYEIHFNAHEMKGRREWTGPFPDQLVPYFRTYAFEALPCLDHDNDPLLFPSKSGKRIAISNLWRIVGNLTDEILDIRCNVHDFRSLVITLYLMEFPNEYRTARDVLGHRFLDTTIRHYIHLTGITASRRLPAFLKACCSSALRVAAWRPAKWLLLQFSGPKNGDNSPRA